MTLYFDRYDLILFLVGTLIVLIVLITILLKMKNRQKDQEKIPGVEEMAKTLFFWSDYHKGRIGEDEPDD